MNVQTLKGFRDFLPKEAQKRQYVIDVLRKVFQEFNFQPLETPALEYEEILLGKYGEEGDKLMYRFQDNGGRKVALRYDQTVPLSRVIAQYQNDLPTPFYRYQIQNVWRGENTQKGRYREFLQCDADIVGSKDPRSDAWVIMTAAAGLVKLGFGKFTVLINDRSIFEGLPIEAIITIDKLKKIGEDGVIEELVARGVSSSAEEARNLLQSIVDAKKPEKLEAIITMIDSLRDDSLKDVCFQYEPTLARGLDYYTGTIFEIEVDGYTAGSVCGGGRYDNLIGMFAQTQIPAVGFAYGFDRILEAMDVIGIIPQLPSIPYILVTIPSEIVQNKSFEVTQKLRNTLTKEEQVVELYLGDDIGKLDKQLKYADKKNIQYVVIPLEGSDKYELRNKDKITNQIVKKQLPLEELLQILQ